jgi:hypothetical protein
MGELAVLDLPLPDPPVLNLTDDEATAIFKASPSGMLKILDNQAEWFGIHDNAKLMKETYINYLRDMFGRDKVKGK